MHIIGRAEVVSFPRLDLTEVRAKVDTGADSSSIHATRVRLKKSEAGEKLSCWLVGKGPFEFTEYDKRKVKSSNGSTELRFAVKLLVKLGAKTYLTTFTLTNRNKMRYPILLGKRFLRGKFLVDVSKKNSWQKKES